MSGGKSNDTQIGWTFFAGMQVIACMHPIDGFSQMNFKDRVAWRGPMGATRIEVNAPNLWGGPESEGGPAGFIDVEYGGPDQVANPYLKNAIYGGEWSPALAGQFALDAYNPGDLQAHRGVTGLVFRRFSWGNVPRLKSFKMKAHNILKTFRASNDDFLNDPVPGNWLPGYAPTCVDYGTEAMSVYIAMDNSGSISAGTADATLREALKRTIDSLTAGVGEAVALRIQPYNTNEGVAFERIPFTAADAQAAKDFIDGVPAPIPPGQTGSGTNYEAAVASSGQFFEDAEAINLGSENFSDYVPALNTSLSNANAIEDVGLAPSIRRVVIFTSDGNGANVSEGQALLEATQADVYAVGVNNRGDLTQIDNTSADSVPIVYTDDLTSIDDFQAFFQRAFITWADLNVAHILRDAHIAPTSGGDGDDTQIGDSFAEWAATFHAEGMGLSFYWEDTGDLDGFIRSVEEHAACVTYRDEETGKIEINGIRPNYNVNELFVLDASTIVTDLKAGLKVNFERPRASELPNHIVLIYTDRETGGTKSISRANGPAVAAAGKIKSKKFTYRGISCDALAAVVLDRLIETRTVPLGKGDVMAAYLPPEIKMGDPFIINVPELGMDNLVVRRDEVGASDGVDNAIEVHFLEDRWQIDPAATTGSVAPIITTPSVGQSRAALPSPTIFSEEAAYFDQVFSRGQSQTDDALNLSADLGNWQITGSPANNAHSQAVVVRNDAGQWVRASSTALMPTWTLRSALSKEADDSTIVVDATGRESELRAEQIIQVGAERMVLRSIVTDNIGRATCEVGRAVLDTVPAEHAAGDILMAWQGYVSTDSLDYIAGETVDLRLLPRNDYGDELDINDAATVTVSMDSRAIRPYPVGDFRVDGQYSHAGELSGVVNVTWAHRNRLTQTSLAILDHTDAGIAPEVGTTLTLKRSLVDDVGGAETVTEVDQTVVPSPEVATAITSDLGALTPSADTVAVIFELEVARGGYLNWQTPSIRVPFNQAPGAPTDPFVANVAVMFRYNLPAGQVVAPPNVGYVQLTQVRMLGNNGIEGDNIAYNGDQTQHYATSWDNVGGGSHYTVADGPVPVDYAQGDLTLEAWVYVTNMNEASTLVRITNAALSEGRGLTLEQSFNGAVEVKFSGPNAAGNGGDFLAVFTGDDVLQEDTWHHVAAVRSGVGWEVFVDGVSRATGTQLIDYGDDFDRMWISVTTGYYDSMRVTYSARYQAPFSPAEFLVPTEFNRITNTFFQNLHTFGASLLSQPPNIQGTFFQNMHSFGSGTVLGGGVAISNARVDGVGSFNDRFDGGGNLNDLIKG